MLKLLMLKFCFDVSFPVLPGAGFGGECGQDEGYRWTCGHPAAVDHGLEDAGFCSSGSGES